MRASKQANAMICRNDREREREERGEREDGGEGSGAAAKTSQNKI